VIEGVVSHQQCDESVQHFRSSVARPRSYQEVVDESRRKCTFVEVPSGLAQFVAKVVKNHVEEHVTMFLR
jgi:hypothetical protein